MRLPNTVSRTRDRSYQEGYRLLAMFSVVIAARRAVFALWAVVLILASQYGVASSLGSFSGRIQDPSGKPLSNILVALLHKSPAPTALPILTRSDEAGEIRLSNLEAGNYELLVKNSQYRSPTRNLVHVLPGETTVLSLVLQQLFGRGSFDEENQKVKTVLRNAGAERLILRHLPRTAGQDSGSPPGGLSSGKQWFRFTGMEVQGAFFQSFPVMGPGGPPPISLSYSRSGPAASISWQGN